MLELLGFLATCTGYGLHSQESYDTIWGTSSRGSPRTASLETSPLLRVHAISCEVVGYYVAVGSMPRADKLSGGRVAVLSSGWSRQKWYLPTGLYWQITATVNKLIDVVIRDHPSYNVRDESLNNNLHHKRMAEAYRERTPNCQMSHRNCVIVSISCDVLILRWLRVTSLQRITRIDRWTKSFTGKAKSQSLVRLCLSSTYPRRSCASRSIVLWKRLFKYAMVWGAPASTSDLIFKSNQSQTFPLEIYRLSIILESQSDYLFSNIYTILIA